MALPAWLRNRIDAVSMPINLRSTKGDVRAVFRFDMAGHAFFTAQIEITVTMEAGGQFTGKFENDIGGVHQGCDFAPFADGVPDGIEFIAADQSMRGQVFDHV
ncbi:Uncharacterised protein [Citrobacter koseri]|nr:Uncharacterised protein [Citrobacter koseri]